MQALLQQAFRYAMSLTHERHQAFDQLCARMEMEAILTLLRQHQSPKTGASSILPLQQASCLP